LANFTYQTILLKIKRFIFFCLFYDVKPEPQKLSVQKVQYLQKEFYFYLSNINGYHCFVQTEAQSRMRVCVCVCAHVECLQGCGKYDWLTFQAYQNGRLDSVIFQELTIFIFSLLFVDILYI